jgi:hypothetical protein
MSYLAATVVILAVVCVLNLILTVAVIRRLREHTTILEQARRPADLLTVGTSVAGVEATAIDGAAVDDEWLREGRKLIALMSSTCSHCLDELGNAADFARAMPGGPASVLAVVSGLDGHGTELVDGLRGVATVVHEPEDGPATTAFSASAFPAFYLVVDGQIRNAGHRVADLRAPAGAAA